MVQIYRRKWARGYFSSLYACIRDAVVLLLPVKKLPSWLVRLLYGCNARFAFLVHPRMYEDIFSAQPFLGPVKLILRKNFAAELISKMPPTVINCIRTPQGVHGFVIAQGTLPEILFHKRKHSRRVLENSLRLAAKICPRFAVVGLGGWFPMVCRRGIALKDFSQLLGLVVTNGHCGTLVSIFMTVEKIANMVNLKLEEITLAIIGVGKMGSNVARAFNGRVKRLILIDINEESVKNIVNELKLHHSNTALEIFISSKNNAFALKDFLQRSHIGVCATSTFRNLVRLRNIPRGFVAIDDSRPEALPRDPSKERIILEGGLLKIKGARGDYDYGFGQDDNVFGCLGEAFLIALNEKKDIAPTLGDVDMKNFYSMINLCKLKGVYAGDFKSSDSFISDSDIERAFQQRVISEKIF